MENKYYLPKIEEFHVGFEYEYLNDTDNAWYKQIFNRGIGFDNNPSIGRCKVKYLNKEDVKSFGFICTGDCGAEKEFQKDYKYGWIVLEMSFDNKITIEYEWENNTIGHTSTRTLFIGKIKNKSELKKLLIQLEIINE